MKYYLSLWIDVWDGSLIITVTFIVNTKTNNTSLGCIIEIKTNNTSLECIIYIDIQR